MEGDRTLVNEIGGNLSDYVADSFLEPPGFPVQSSAGDEEENEGGNVSDDLPLLELQALRSLRSDLQTMVNAIGENFLKGLQVQSSADEEEKEGRILSYGPIRVVHSRSLEIQALRLECADLHVMLAPPEKKGRISRMWHTFILDSLELDNALAENDRILKKLADLTMVATKWKNRIHECLK